MSQISELTELLVEFREERDWAQFHTPRNLAAAVSIEAGELQEHFLWEDEGATEPDSDSLENMRDEIADVLIFALLFCHEADIDPARAVRRKLDKNRRKYPVNKARGRSAKYTELDES